MKKLLLFVVALTSVNAFATKARYKALNSSFHLTDTQTVYTSPYHLFSLKDFVAIESGATGSTTVDNGAEGSALMSINESSKILVSLGHLDTEIQSQRKFLNAVATTTFKTQQNPIEIIYALKTGSTVWAAGLFYSNYEDKVAVTKETSTGFHVGASYGDIKWKANVGLTNKAENTTDGSFTGSPYVNLAGRYNLDTLRFGLDYTVWDAKLSNPAGVETESHSYSDIKFQLVDTKAKDGDEFFYGLAIDSLAVKSKLDDKKLTRLAMPIWIGLEAQANSWLTIRSFIKQTVLIAQSKNEKYGAGVLDGAIAGAGEEYGSEPNNTEAGIGAGFKLSSNLLVDGTFKGLVGKTATQDINATNFLAQAGMTYTF